MTVVELDRVRRERVGGSEAASACGVDPHRSRVMLWAEKLGLVERPATEAMRWGTLLEPVVYAELEERGYELVPCPQTEWRHDARPWLVGTPDGFVDLDGERGVLEVKTAGQHAAHDWRSDANAPLGYIVQVHHYMELTGCESALLACLIGGQRLEIRTVRRDERLLDLMLSAEEEFLDYVRRDTPPPPDGSSSASEAIRVLYPDAAPGKTVRLQGDDWQAFKRLRELHYKRDVIGRQYKEALQTVQLVMGDAERALSPNDNEVARWTSYTRNELDVTAFRAKFPELHGEFTEPRIVRRFTVE